MQILEKESDDKILRILVDSDEESLFSLLKVYLMDMADVDIAGYTKEHHLVDKTEFFLKVTKGTPEEVFKKGLALAKKDLESKKL